MNMTFPLRWKAPHPWHRSVIAAIAPTAVVTLLAVPPGHPPTALVAVIYVLAVVVAARLGGPLPGAAAATLAFLALNFFFTLPVHTFAVAAPEDLVALIVFLVVAMIVGLLLSSAVEAKEKAQRRELEARLLNRVATRLLSGKSTENVLTDLAEGIRDLFGYRRCEIHTSLLSSPVAAGQTMDSPPRVVHAKAPGDEIGEIRIWAGEHGAPISNDLAAIGSLATQLALALEGIRLRVEVRRAELDAQSSQLKAALFSGVTHDVKTPIAAIMASVTSLLEGRGFSEADRRDHLETIKDEAERLHRVVNNLLDVARLRAGALVPTKAPTSIDEVMESVIHRLRPLFHGRAIEMRVADDVPEILIDMVQIDQVLTNLIENAVKFTPPGSPISLSVVGSDEIVRVTVADHGPGVRAEDRTRIFESFERGEGSASGTGLGLTISAAIVVAHGGRMWVSNNAAGGASFTFELPVGGQVLGKEVTDGGSGSRR
jgi:two-component system sensor histidine kinase KdpD